ncbi:MAG: hypothetical protein KatS3mg115_2455 [Candidatus Poribacteria bacterium]|nr:MAG: hypothetical protein KatS3mg115_2455 [Candidatus Poribacteria bacterium]
MRFRLASGVHITGERVELGVDKAFVVDWHMDRSPVPIVPATTLKGWLREGAERVLRGVGLSACDGSSPQTVCGECLVCKVFGSPQRRSPLRFRDVRLREALWDVRANVSLSRHRKAAYEERLFFSEVAWQSGFEARVMGVFPSQEEALQAAALLYLPAQLGVALGAARSRGLGWVELEDFSVRWNGESEPLSRVLQRAEEILKGAPEKSEGNG